jgi:hypothetical protein
VNKGKKMEAKHRLYNILSKYLGGHINIGDKITQYGFNAMHCATVIKTKKYGYIHFSPTVLHWKWKLFVSPDATPSAATFAIGPGINSYDRARAIMRRVRFGHNYSIAEWSEQYPEGITTELELLHKRCE